MAPPIRYTTEAIVAQLRESPSLLAFSQISGMSMGALKNRVRRSDDVRLHMAWQRCRDRGLARRKTPRRAS